MTTRALLSDEQWRIVAPLLTGKAEDPGRTGADNRKTFEGILHILWTGSQWRMLPERFGKWNTVHRRYRRWVKAKVFEQLFGTSSERDLRTIMADGTYIKLHRNAAGARRNGLSPAKSKVEQKIGRSHGGLTTKVLAVVDANGRPIRFVLAPGNRHEAPLLLDAIRDLEADEFIADKAYDSKRIRKHLRERGVTAVIPSKANSKKPISYDANRYKLRHKVENLFVDLKEYRSVGTRYCKQADSYEAFVHLAAWMNETRR